MTYSASLTKLDGTTISVDRLFSTSLSLNHTALHTATIETFASTAGTDEAFADIDIDLDGSALFRGEIVEPQEDQPTEGYSTLRAVGPGYELTRETPNSEISYSDINAGDAIEDYWNNHLDNINTDVTVTKSAQILEDDAQIENIPTDTAFSSEFSIANDVPAQFNNSEIQLQRHGFIGITKDFSGTFTTKTDSSGDSYFHINAEYAVLDASGENVVYDPADEGFQVNHDIPADRVGVAIHYKAVNATNTVDGATLTVNGTSVGFEYQEDKDPVSGNMKWAVFDGGEYSNNGGADLAPGDTPDIEFALSESGEIEVDGLYLYDTNYPPTKFDEPATFEEKIKGPSFFPGDVELTSVDHGESGNIIEGRLETTWNETTNDQRLSLSNNGGGTYLNKNNASNFTADFDGNNVAGTTLKSKVRLSGTDDGNGVWLSNNISGQHLEDYKLYVTTEDEVVITDLTLRKDHFRNLQELHRGGYRFVVDPTVRDPLTVEVFRDGGDGSKKTDDWVTISADKTRDVRDYANQIKYVYNDTNGNYSTITVQRNSEVQDKADTVLQQVAETTSNLTTSEARTQAIQELNAAVAIDKVSGTVEAWAKLILPGYTYTVDEWGIDASITRVRYSESADGATMTLQFVNDRDVTQQVIENI